MDVPKAYLPRLNQGSPERDLALTKGQMLGLREHFQKHFKDPRRTNRIYPASSLLVFMSMALFAGRDTLTSIQRYGNLLTSQQRRWLDFPVKKGTSVRKAPSWSALYNFVTQINPQEFADCLNLWLGSNLGSLPCALAVDGKWIRDQALSLCLSEHETGAPVAVGFAEKAAKTDENKREGEQTVALRPYEKTNLEGATITQAGGNYFLQLKNENRHADKAADQLAREGSPLLPIPKNRIPATDASTAEP
jgi:hypothetical protein